MKLKPGACFHIHFRMGECFSVMSDKDVYLQAGFCDLMLWQLICEPIIGQHVNYAHKGDVKPWDNELQLFFFLLFFLHCTKPSGIWSVTKGPRWPQMLHITRGQQTGHCVMLYPLEGQPRGNFSCTVGHHTGCLDGCWKLRDTPELQAFVLSSWVHKIYLDLFPWWFVSNITQKLVNGFPPNLGEASFWRMCLGPE